MSKYLTGLALTAAVVAAGLVVSPAFASKAEPKKPGTLIVYDEAKYFSAAGIERAKAAMSNTLFDHGLTVTVDTYSAPPADKKDAAEAAKGNKEKWHSFMHDWARSQAQGDKAKGIYILVCAHPGGVEVIADRETRDRGFSNENEKKVRDILLKSFQEAANEPDQAKKTEIRDAALKAAVDYIITDLKDTTVKVDTTNHNTTTNNRKPGGMSIGGWICIGLCVLLGVWLVFGLIRAFTGGGGGGGGGYGGGGGGGGFMSSLFGGLFGAMAGMWLYNNMFGHSGMFGGSDAYAGDSYGDAGGATDGNTGAGDFSGDEGAGGGFDDGGGGDTGGGGDWGGGGDFGGGGGDFGGGGGDF